MVIIFFFITTIITNQRFRYPRDYRPLKKKSNTNNMAARTTYLPRLLLLARCGVFGRVDNTLRATGHEVEGDRCILL